MPTPRFSVDDAIEILRRLEKTPYEDEAVNQLQHALQTAQFARGAKSDNDMVAAALLHDIGRAPEVLDRYGPGGHDRVGAAFCADHICARAAFLVGQHVAAKRYLVATRPGYSGILSPASVRSLRRQGGPMTSEEAAEFESHPFHEEAAQLRYWDDSAKDRTARTDDLPSYAGLLTSVWVSP
ncbi:HD domain-containing protein [Mycobacterium parmense]|uniref:Phosphodiesterase n=1 Tax=Mycobacterium parmense TaxID=185642 RepID=A0A7I7YSC4_9MYCO|nr:HD domain-containing protein [Mycobacterium parmense]MCV7351787.1 HD domain-containing protein [Mycobacterium parmense]ORW63009.1 hypothetical protein AWC20_04545 [Mycobacterium parmense]BBZ44745.1 phosphodiesterase [Mycobacterium parmense]